VVRLAKELDSKKYEDDQRLISDASTVLEGIKAEIEVVNRAKEQVDEENTDLCSEIKDLKDENHTSLLVNTELSGTIIELTAQNAKKDIIIGAIFIFSILLTIFLGAIF